MSADTVNASILVTGATGFLGRAIVRQLANSPYYVRTSGRRKAVSEHLPNYHAADLSDCAAATDLVEGVDVVIHSAGLTHDPTVAVNSDDDFYRVNAEGTRSLIYAAANAGCKRFVMVSSISVYGRQDSPISESAVCRGASAYAKSKRAAEKTAAETAERVGMSLAILRMAPICGEGARGNVDRLMKVIDRRAFIWVGAGQNRKSLIHVDDAARACVAAATFEPCPYSGIFNVAAPPCTMSEIVTALSTSLGRKIPPFRLPGEFPLRIVGGASRLAMIGRIAHRASSALDKWLSEEVYDSALFRQSFNWCSQVRIDEALARQVAHYRSALSRSA